MDGKACVSIRNQEHNGDTSHCPVRALGHWYMHICANSHDLSTFLSAFFVNNASFDVTDRNIRFGIKRAASALQYPVMKGIPIH